MSYRKILVPLDGSEWAEQTLEYIPAVADPCAQIHLLSVVNAVIVDQLFSEPESPFEVVNNVIFSVTAELRPHTQVVVEPKVLDTRYAYLSQVSHDLKNKGYQVTFDACPGHIVNTILDVAKTGFDLVIMTTHGRSGLRRLFLGSVAAGVLPHAPCPVLLVPMKG